MPDQKEPVVLEQKELENLFEKHTLQGDLVTAIFKMLYPGDLWDRIEKLIGYPVCSPATSEWIMNRFIRFDQKHHPNVMAGGAWMNYGFSNMGGESLPLFHVVPADYSLKPADAPPESTPESVPEPADA